MLTIMTHRTENSALEVYKLFIPNRDCFYFDDFGPINLNPKVGKNPLPNQIKSVKQMRYENQASVV